MAVIYVDVDDTLIRSFGSKRIPMTSTIQRVRELARMGATLYCWSFGGADYAKETAMELELADCFQGYLTKPDILIDDQEPREWRLMTCLHPNALGSLSPEKLKALTTKR